MDKLITFAVPCYNSAAYMDHCVETLLQGGDDIEIILVDDGSTKDDTPAICDRYAQQYPDIVRAIHQENGGHGEGVNQGIRNARGVYYKVVDSDDWVDVPALKKALDKLRQFVRDGKLVDMLVCNYVYEHVEDNTQRVMHYRNVFPRNRVFGWEQIGRFRPSQYLLMHSVIYRTQLLRDCGLELPKHTFYVDNIFVYQPLPLVRNIYYLDVDLYRYFIGRADQSVNELADMGIVPGGAYRNRDGDGGPGGPAAAGHLSDDRLPRPAGPHCRAAQAGAVHVQLSGHDDGHLLHLPHHRRHPRVPGEEDPAVGISADGGHRDLSQDEVPGRLRLYQFPGLSGPAAVGGPLPAGSEEL